MNKSITKTSKMTKDMKSTGLYISVSILLASLLTACGRGEQSYRVEALRVTTETVFADSVNGVKHYVGKVEEDSSTPLSFSSMGTVNKVYVEDGQYVARNQLIAELDPTQFENTFRASKATLDQALDAQERVLPLHESKAISDIDWVDIQTKVRQAQAQYDVACKALEDCKMYAPCNGIIASRRMESGMTTRPSEPVCYILDISRVKVKVSVPEKEISLFNPSQSKNINATVTAEALGSKTFHSTSFMRNVQGNPMTHTYDVRFILSNPGHVLLPGMVVNLSMEANNVDDGQRTVTVPVRCVQQGADGHQFVWLEKNGKATRQTVTAGQPCGDRITILSGLTEGDKVIVEGYQKVSEGSEIIS